MRTFNDLLGLGAKPQRAFGCGCGGRKTAPRPTASSASVAPKPSGTSRVAAAKTYQSATMRSAPTGPVTRKQV